jgi:hypothetical protein
MERHGMRHSRAFSIRSNHPYFAKFREGGCQDRQAGGLDAIVIGDENSDAGGRHKKSCVAQLLLIAR